LLAVFTNTKHTRLLVVTSSWPTSGVEQGRGLSKFTILPACTQYVHLVSHAQVMEIAVSPFMIPSSSMACHIDRNRLKTFLFDAGV